jgi:hypothetical protein
MAYAKKIYRIENYTDGKDEKLLVHGCSSAMIADRPGPGKEERVSKVNVSA